ncbi:hypothetical protein Tco_0632310 [Tanacetum coccineum]
MMTFINWYCRKVNKTMLTQADFEGQAYEVVKAFYPDVIQLQFQLEECYKMLTDQVDWTNPEGDQTEYLRYGRKGSSPALSISKMKAASYPDIGLELLVPEQMWIDDVCTDDISAKYGISHWWFNRQKFYIDRHDSTSHRKEVRTHMRILSVVRIKAYSRYRSSRSSFWFRQTDVINCRQAVDQKLSDSDCGGLFVEDFQLGMKATKLLNLTKPGWDATGYKFTHDFTIIESPRAVVFPVNNNERKIMRFNEIYKFSGWQREHTYSLETLILQSQGIQDKGGSIR